MDQMTEISLSLSAEDWAVLEVAARASGQSLEDYIVREVMSSVTVDRLAAVNQKLEAILARNDADQPADVTGEEFLAVLEDDVLPAISTLSSLGPLEDPENLLPKVVERFKEAAQTVSDKCRELSSESCDPG